MGSVVSWEHWEAGLIFGLAQWLRIQCCPICGLGRNCGLDLIPGPELHMFQGAYGKKERKEKKRKGKGHCLKIWQCLFLYVQAIYLINVAS